MHIDDFCEFNKFILLSLDDEFSEIDLDLNYYNDIFSSIDSQHQSDYYSVLQFNDKFKGSDSSNITIFNYNIRSYNKNFTAFSALLDTLNIYLLTYSF